MQDNERDEAITEARIAGTSTRALAKLHNCTGREIEEAVDRRLDYDLDGRQKLRLVKLSVGRIEALMTTFYERAVKDKDVAAGTLCCRLEERLSLLLGLDHPAQSRVNIYAVEQQQKPSQYAQITAALMSLKYPNGRPGDGDALAPPTAPSGADDPDREPIATGTDRETVRHSVGPLAQSNTYASSAD